MTMLFESGYVRTLDALVAAYAGADRAGGRLEAWLFEDEPSRSAAESALARCGVEARLRSAYKPLLHAFLEDIDLSSIASIVVRYPVVPQAPANRFLLEAYPLAALVGDRDIAFEPVETSAPVYEVELHGPHGQRTSSVFAPNRLHPDASGETVLSPTGWVRFRDADGTMRRDERLATDIEALFGDALATVAGHGWGVAQPCFEALNLNVTLPVRDRPLPVGEEAISLVEALSEDLYFSLLEHFGRTRVGSAGEQALRPGQIVPRVRFAEGAASLRIETSALFAGDMSVPSVPLETVEAPLGLSAIGDALRGVSGTRFTARSRAGRIVEALHRPGTDRAVMISGGQHGNEATGIVGALRAAAVLDRRPGAHFTLAPVENPDGSALHLQLAADNPRHMHHAARYTAYGDDLEGRDGVEPGEWAVRKEARRRSGAALHINLHGYPSHEWTRPFSGYIPRGFAMWTLPKGFFLILRHHADWTVRAVRVLDAVTRRLAAFPGLLAFNAAQTLLCDIHGGSAGFHRLNGIACLVRVETRDAPAMTLITEYPDETLTGPAFVAGHTAQMEVVLAAYDAFQALDEEPIA